MGTFMGTVKKIITKMNLFIASILLTSFYILVIPFGKLIYIISHILSKENKDTYWQKTENKKLDLNSPY